jgi:prepilin-type N-terminal cleavage/methylation domain-containing protein
MKLWPEVDRTRRAFSLLEMMAATTIMALVMVSVVVVVRSGYTVWNAYEDDVDVAENAYGVLRHFVRELRQAQAVTAISAPTDTTGDLSYSMASGAVHTVSLNGGTSQVTLDNGTTTNLLATSIDQMSFVGYEADGVTPTIVADDIQLVKCTAQVTLSIGGGTTRTVSTSAWIRSW